MTARLPCDEHVNTEVNMTRKHFVLLADAIRQNIANKQERQTLAKALMPALLASNPNFNAARFMNAAVGE